MGPEDIYQSMADAIANEKDIKFARKLVEQLNAIMFTAAEVSSLREQIKHLSTPVSSNRIIAEVKTASLYFGKLVNPFHIRRERGILSLPNGFDIPKALIKSRIQT